MSIRRAWAVSEKEFRFILRDPRSLGVTLVLPVALLALFGYAINFDIKNISLAVYDPDNTPASRDLAQALTRSGSGAANQPPRSDGSPIACGERQPSPMPR